MHESQIPCNEKEQHQGKQSSNVCSDQQHDSIHAPEEADKFSLSQQAAAHDGADSCTDNAVNDAVSQLAISAREESGMQDTASMTKLTVYMQPACTTKVQIDGRAGAVHHDGGNAVSKRDEPGPHASLEARSTGTTSPVQSDSFMADADAQADVSSPMQIQSPGGAPTASACTHEHEAALKQAALPCGPAQTQLAQQNVGAAESNSCPVKANMEQQEAGRKTAPAEAMHDDCAPGTTQDIAASPVLDTLAHVLPEAAVDSIQKHAELPFIISAPDVKAAAVIGAAENVEPTKAASNPLRYGHTCSICA